MKYLRLISQGLFLLLFLWLFLQTESKGANDLGYPVKIFLDADPFIFITTALSSRALDTIPYLAIVIVFATLILGRFFCGWLCPLGTLNDLTGSLTRRPFRAAPSKRRRLKYYLLIFLLVSSLFSLQLVGIVDPFSLLIRSFSLTIYPLISYATGAVFDAFYSLNVPFVGAVSEAAYGFLKKTLLPFTQPFFLQSLFVGFLFFLVLGLNLIEKRFWCKNLCPLGALLGIFSRYALLKRFLTTDCNTCGACDVVCDGGALSSEKAGWKNTECILCMNCNDLCPKKAVQYRFLFKGIVPATPMDLGRRNIISSVLAGVIAVPLLKVSPVGKKTYLQPKLIRPPGTLDESAFLDRCVKCGECMKVCITNGLQPTLLEAGMEGVWSPVLVPRIGHCEYRCTLCGQVCPTGAIKNLTMEEKSKIKIGTAMIDKGRCLPYAHGISCIVCEEVCPTSKKAIWFENTTIANREGQKLALKQPHVDLERCIGCGICEAKCPVIGQPAIYVTSIGESRSKENQLLLS